MESFRDDQMRTSYPAAVVAVADLDAAVFKKDCLSTGGFVQSFGGISRHALDDNANDMIDLSP